MNDDGCVRYGEGFISQGERICRPFSAYVAYALRTAFLASNDNHMPCYRWFCLLTCIGAAAQEPRSVFDMDIAELMTIRVSVASSRAEYSHEAPVIVSRIDAATARALGAQTLAEWLGLLPGVIVQSTAIGVDAVMMRGLVEGFNQKVLFLLDGVPYWSPTHSDFPLSAIPLALIAHVEVIRGPGGIIYGSNATAGVINVVTRQSGSDSAALALGSQHHDRAEWFSRFAFDDAQLILALSHANGPDYAGEFTARPLPSSYPQTAPRSGKVDRDSAQDALFLRYVSPELDLRWHTFQRSSEGLAAAASMLNRSTLEYKGQQLTANYHRLIEQQSIDWFADYTQFGVAIPTANIFAGQADGEQRFTNDGHDNTRLRVGSRWQYEFADQSWWQLGLEHEQRDSGEYQLRRDDDSLAAIQMATDRLTEAALYAQWDQRNDNFRTVIGLRYVDNDQFGSALLPRLTFAYQPSNQQSWRLVYSEGYNAPVFLQLNIQIPPNALIGNPELAAERVKNLELAWSWQNKYQQINVSTYRLEVDDAIQRRLIPNTTTVSFFNVLPFVRHGVELDWQMHLEQWQIMANYSWQQQGNSTADPFALFAPKQQLNIGINYLFDTQQWGLSWRHIGARAAADAINLLTLQYHYQWPHARLGINLQNLLSDDEQHADVQDLAALRLVASGPDKPSILLTWQYEF